jgi:hypothetical protein
MRRSAERPAGVAPEELSSVQVAEEEEDQDDRQRDADEPKKTAFEHGDLRTFLLNNELIRLRFRR